MKRFAALLMSFTFLVSMTLSGCNRINAVPESPDIPVVSTDPSPAELPDDINNSADDTVNDINGGNHDAGMDANGGNREADMDADGGNREADMDTNDGSHGAGMDTHDGNHDAEDDIHDAADAGNADFVDDTGEPADGSHEDSETSPDSPGRSFINVYWSSDELYQIIMRYKELHPDFPYEIRAKKFQLDDYYSALGELLAVDDDDMPDIYCIESAYVKEYTLGDKARYAASYKDLGIDVDNLVKEADIHQYVIDMGTNTDGEVVALGYWGTGGAFIYRRSIAKDVWGTDDPEIIKGKIGPDWDRFLHAAAELKDAGYAIVPGYQDVWYSVDGGAEMPWVVDGRLCIDPAREAFLDIAKQLHDNEYTNNRLQWTDDWFADMLDAGPRKVFGYFGPTWLINYIMISMSGGVKPGEGTYGDWAVCEPPAGFFWGGNWVFVNRNSPFKEDLAHLIEWITLDSSETGLQYSWASGTYPVTYGYQEAVPSGTVMRNVSGVMDFLGSQDMLDMYDKCAKLANGRNKTQYDEIINYYWLDAVREYAEGRKTREQAITDFKQKVRDELDIDVD